MSFNPRDLEWQRRYQEQDTPWDKGSPAPPLVNYLQKHRLSGRALVPGCGRGHEVRALLEFSDCTVTGLDLSEAAIRAAQISTEEWIASAEYNSESELSRYQYLEGDFFKLPAELTGTFDWIIEHTCFCAIEPKDRPTYVKAAAQALIAGGRLFGIFYIDPEREVGPPFGVTPDDITKLFGSSFVLEEEWVPAEAFPGRENRELVRVLRKL